MNRLKSAIEKVLKVQCMAPRGCKGGGLCLGSLSRGAGIGSSSGRRIRRHTHVSQQVLITLGKGITASHVGRNLVS